MANVDLRLTKTGILQPNGILDEVTHSNVKFTKTGVYAAQFDETSNIAVPMRFNKNGLLQVSGSFDEVNKPYVYAGGGGGTVSAFTSGDSTYSVHSFTTSGSFTLQNAVTVDILLVGGGAGGGIGERINNVNYYSQSVYGNPGQVVSSTQTLNPGTYSVTIGNGGNGSRWIYEAGYGYLSTARTNGTASSFNGLTAAGGSGFIPLGTAANLGISSSITGTSRIYGCAPATNIENINNIPVWSSTDPGCGSQSGRGRINLSNPMIWTSPTDGGDGGGGVVIIRYSSPANK